VVIRSGSTEWFYCVSFVYIPAIVRRPAAVVHPERRSIPDSRAVKIFRGTHKRREKRGIEVKLERSVAAFTVIVVIATFSIFLATPVAASGPPSGGAGATTWYVAEGSTAETPDGDFHTYISIMNPNPNDTELDIQFQTPEGPIDAPTMVLGRESAMTVSVEDYVPNKWSVSTRVDSAEPVTVDRYTTFQYPGETTSYKWAHGSLGVTEPNNSWFLAEGSTGVDGTGYFETWILVQNPTANDTVIDISFQTPAGTVPGPTGREIKAGQRQTFNVADYVPSTWGVSTAMTTRDGGRVVCERAMYWSTWVTQRQSAHASIGTPSAGSNWYLAEGSTGTTPWTGSNPDAGNFESWILVQNPTATDARVDISFQTPRGEVKGPQSFQIRAGRHHSLDVSQWVKNEWSVSTSVTCKPGGGGVIAERAMYWNLPQGAVHQADPNMWKRYVAHDSIGAMNRFREWEVAGMTLSNPSFESWILVQNPSNDKQDITVFFYTDSAGGGRIGPVEYVMPAHSRKTFDVSDYVASSVGTIGATVEVMGFPSDPGIVVEHSSYWGFGQGEDPQGYRQIGWDSIGHAELP
jgi:hypothetical protein